MSAAQPKANEPSMEEILASIRRIISDDQPGKPAVATPSASPAAAAAAPMARPVVPPPAPAKHDDDEEILELTPKTRAPRKQEPHFLTDDPVDNDLSFQDPSLQAPVPPPQKAEVPKGQDDIDALMAAAEFDPAPPVIAPSIAAAMAQERLVSSHTDRAVSTAFSSLTNTVLANNGKTLDDVVTEMLRPMLKGWLDDNLPGIVERLVRAEIERVARGGR